jgi:ankyrin repeat protein
MMPWRGPMLALALLSCGEAAAADHRLADAVERRDAPAIEALLARNIAVNAPQADGAAPLHWAAYWDDLALVKRLIAARANVNAANDHGVTALGLACENGNVAIVSALLSAGAGPNIAPSSGETPLMTAARVGALDVVEALLSGGAGVNAREGSHQQTALMWAVSRGHGPVVRRLIEAGADVNEAAPNGASALVIAAHSGQGAVATYLLERGAEPDAGAAGYSALHAAILRGDLVLVQALVAHGANPNAPLAKGTPSRYYSKDYAFNESLVGATPFWLAARYGEPEIMRVLAEAGADTRPAMADGTTALMTAIIPTRGLGTFRAGDRRERYQGPGDVAEKGEEEDEALTLRTAATAIELGADVNAVTDDGETALHLAAALGLTGIVQLLVDSGARLDVRNKRGLTPLGAATATQVRGQAGAFAPTVEQRRPTAELLRRLGATE